MESGQELCVKQGSNEDKFCELCRKIGHINCSKCRSVWYCTRDHQRQHWDEHYAECKVHKVENSPDAGNYMVASCNIRAGHKIMTEEPICIGPMMISLPICLVCHHELSEENYVKCPDCLWPMCSSKCFCAKKHDEECLVLSKDKKNCVAPDKFASTPRYDIILIIRCMLLRETDRSQWNLLLSMESHWEKLKESDDQYHTTGIRVLSEIFGYPVDLVHRIRGIIVCNAIQVRGPDGNLLRALYGNINLLNHSCIPNIHLSCNLSGKMEARAAIDIPKEESLTICYSGTLLPTWERRLYLYQLHHFVCNCKRCSDPTELGSYFSCPRCPKCLREYLVPLGATPMDDSWQCQKCKTECDKDEIAQEIDDWLFRMDMNELFGSGSLRRITNALSKIEFSFHRLHYLYLKGSQEVLQKLKNNSSFQALKIKRDIWINMMNIFDLLEPGLTLRKGMSLYELGSVLISLAEEGAKEEMSQSQAETYRREGIKMYQSSINILSLEPMGSPESKIVPVIMKKISDADVSS